MGFTCVACAREMIEYPDDPQHDTVAYTIWGGNALCERHFLHEAVSQLFAVDDAAAERAQKMVDALYVERRAMTIGG